MKIGILTFHRASNYGAVLQAYALQTTLKKLGSDAEIIDYYCTQVEKDHRPGKVFEKFGVIKGCVKFPVKLRRYKIFERFRQQHLHLSSGYTAETISEIAEKYDRFITGSDQVWNDRLSGLDKNYFLAFANPEKRYSYAASLGFSQFPQGTADFYRSSLKSFKSVSVREQSAKDLLEKELGIQVRVDLDPSMLLTAEEWQKIQKKPEISSPYILVYTVPPPVHLLDYARKLSQETGFRIIYLNNELRGNKDLKHIRYASPEEFIGWIANAEYVVTNSFHGTAFSHIFNKSLVVETNTKKSFNSRSNDLMVSCGTTDQILQTKEQDLTFEIDWEQVNQRLAKYRDLSTDYLKTILTSGSGDESY